MIPPLIAVPRARNMQLMHALSQRLRFLLNLKAFDGLFFYELSCFLNPSKISYLQAPAVRSSTADLCDV